MKSKINAENAINSYDAMNTILKKHFNSINSNNPESVKQASEYYKWTNQKTRLILDENNFKIPSSALPNIIQNSTFKWLRPEKQNIILKYYKFDTNNNKYIISVKKDSVLTDDINLIMHSIVLIRKTVVWVDFGYNIGSEFGGKHPAIILKNLDDSLIVIPLSSKAPKTMNYSVKVDKIYGFSLKPRWANVTRITQVSLSRVNFEKIGDVKPSVITEIRNKLKECGIY